jgi:anti-sigma factor RsiW
MSCARAEIVAGAIALGEAKDEERHAYRAHLAQCARCVGALGGERDIERTMSVVSRARNDERWQPDVRRQVLRARGTPWRAWASASAAAAIVVLGVAVLQHHTVIPRRNALPVPAQQSAAIAALGTQSIPSFEQRAESLQFRDGATLTLRVVVDARGKPVRCTVVRGLRTSLDGALCATLLRTRR